MKVVVLSSFFFKMRKLRFQKINLSKCRIAKHHAAAARFRIQAFLDPKCIISPSHYPHYLLGFLPFPYAFFPPKAMEFYQWLYDIHLSNRIAANSMWAFEFHRREALFLKPKFMSELL